LTISQGFPLIRPAVCNWPELFLFFLLFSADPHGWFPTIFSSISLFLYFEVSRFVCTFSSTGQLAALNEAFFKNNFDI
jgi:hypothetical protein